MRTGREPSRPLPPGGFRMGNPDARVKLIEYGSLACPHCRHFEETGYKPLVERYVRTGRVSYEFRNFLLNGAGRFGQPARALRRARQVLPDGARCVRHAAAVAGQDRRAERRAESGARQDGRRSSGSSASPRSPACPQIAARFGVTPAQARQCLADPQGLCSGCSTSTKAAQDSGIHGTPTFLINGK